METTDNKQLISQEDMADCVEFVKDFCNELGKYPCRTTSSEDEHACARAIRTRLHHETDAFTRLEAFGAYPMLGRGMFLFMGLWFAVCYVMYYLSFAGSEWVAKLLTLLALVLFVGGNAVLVSLYLGKTTFQQLLVKKPCYNVVSEYSKTNNGGERVFIICDNHDTMLGSPIKDFDLMRKLSMVIAPVSWFVFVFFCVLKIALGIHDGDVVGKISAFTVIPTMTGILGISAFVLHYSPYPRNARKKNDVSTAVAMATYAYFIDNELVDDDTKLVYLSLGGENTAHCGSRAFVQAHPEFSNATVLCVGDIQTSDFEIAEYDAVRKIEFSTDLVAKVLAVAKEQGINARIMPHDTFKQKFNSLHGFTSNAFAQSGVKTTTILAKDYSKAQKNIDIDDIEKLFTLTVGSLQKLMHSNKSMHSDANTNVEIVDVVGK